MKAFRFRTMVLAVMVVSGSVAAGIGLGLILTNVAQAGDKPRTASNRPKKNTANVAVNQGGSRANANASAAGGRVLSLNQGGFGPSPSQVAAELGVRILNFDPRTLPNHGKQVLAPAIVRRVTPLPMWNYNVTASSDLGGGNYSGTIIGRDPRNRGKGTTTIPTQIVPLVITIDDGTNIITYDPTVPDPTSYDPNTGACVPVRSDVDIITGSPIFTNNNWTMNGVNVGNTQYHDAFQRTQFWSLVGGSAYHLILNQSTLSSQALSFSKNNPNGNGESGPGQNYNAKADFGGCGFIGVVQINDLDNAVFNLMTTGPLAAMVNAGTLPIFLTKNVVMTNSGISIFSNCCILGYHSAFYNPFPNIQVYSPFSLDTSGVFGGDVDTLSHEIGEAINDPTAGNPTPTWGNIGQTVGTCQSNFEVGDPLSEGFGTPTNPFTVKGGNGLTYHLQELAFFSWFYGGPSLGSGGKYSNNGSFQGDAILCADGGGTN